MVVHLPFPQIGEYTVKGHILQVCLLDIPNGGLLTWAAVRFHLVLPSRQFDTYFSNGDVDSVKPPGKSTSNQIVKPYTLALLYILNPNVFCKLKHLGLTVHPKPECVLQIKTPGSYCTS